MSALQTFFCWSGVVAWAVVVSGAVCIALARHWNGQGSTYGGADQ